MGAWQPTPAFLLENPTDRGAWWATARRVAESDTTEAAWHTHRQAWCFSLSGKEVGGEEERQAGEDPAV